MVKFLGVDRGGRRTSVVCSVATALNIGNPSEMSQQRDRLAASNFAFVIH